MEVPVIVAGSPITAIVDTAAQVTIMSEELSRELGLGIGSCDPIRLVTADGASLVGRLIPAVPLQLGSRSYSWGIYAGPITDQLILGLDFLSTYRCIIDLDSNFLVVGGEVIVAVLRRNKDCGNAVFPVHVASRTVIPPNHARVLEVKLKNAESGYDYMINPLGVHPGCWLPSALVRVAQGNAYVDIANTSRESVLLHPGQLLASAELVGSSPRPTPDRTELRGPPQPVVRIISGSAVVPNIPDDRDRECSNKQVKSNMALVEGIPPGRLNVDGTAATGVPEHLVALSERARKELNEEQVSIMLNLLREFQDVFSRGDSDLGRYTTVCHTIDTQGADPVRQRMRRTPLAFLGEEEKVLNTMLGQGVLQPSTSDWASAPVLVRKKDGSVRYCVDYRELNSKTRKDAFPLPLIDECLDALDGTQWLSTLDMASGYHQISMAPEDRHKTAFITKFGLFEYVRMPFGLCNAPATFQRAMNLVLEGLTWKQLLAYIDDVIVLGKTFDEHIANLREVFRRFRANHLKLKPKKCSLFCKEVDFLGRTVSRDGVSIANNKVEAVLSWPVPTNTTQVEAFLGFINYHREFIPKMAEMAEGLYRLTGKAEFCWGPDQQRAFKSLKEAMVVAPVLAYPNSDDPFLLDTDASDKALGAELSQCQNGVERVIGYASFSLTPCQRRYCTTRKELLAVVRGTRHFRHYVYGRKFTVRTDHQSLTWLLRFKLLDGQLARWSEELSQYDMVLIHRPGVKHQNADGLSRIPHGPVCDCYEAGKEPTSLPCGGCDYCVRVHRQWDRFERDVDDVVPLAIRSLGTATEEPPAEPWLPSRSPTELRDLQLADPDLLPIIRWLEEGVEPPQGQLFVRSAATKHLWRCRSQLSLRQGVLYYRWELSGRVHIKLVAPLGLRDEILYLAHDVRSASHQGQDRTLGRVRASFFWPSLSLDVALYVRTCAVCSKNKKPRIKARAGQTSYHAGVPMERVHLDILGPLVQSDAGNRYVLMMVDQFTKWVECIPLPDQTAERLAEAALHNFFCRLGLPLQIHTDQGRNFTGRVFSDLCARLQIAKTRTTPYRPNANGQVERYNRTLLQAIRCLLPERQSSWDAHLPLVGMALRAGVNRTTGFSPNLMMLGREVLSPLELVTGVSAENLHEQEPAQYVRELLQRMKSVHDEARRHVGLVQRTQKKTYDLHLHERSYEKGDLVYQRNEAGQVGQSRKLQPIFIGPVLVTQVLSPVLFRVENRKRSYVLHHDRLIPCKDRVIPLWIRRKRHDLLGDDTTLDEDDEEVEADILPEWWRRQDAEAGQGATARPPAPPGGPVGIKLPGKSATITPPDAPPSFVEGEVGSVSGKGPQSPIRPPTPLGGEPGSPVPPTSVPEVRSRTGRVVRRPKHLDTDFLLY